MKIKDLQFNGTTAIILRYGDGSPALSFRNDFFGYRADVPGTYAICDENDCAPIDPEDDVAASIAEWQAAVGWERG